MMEMRSRIAVFQVAPLGKRIGKYVYFLAKSLLEVSDRLVIVCNGAINDEDNRELNKISAEVFVRMDEGFDSGAFKEALEKFITWEEVYKYDEMLLVNDSCYGPIYPLCDVFEEMGKRGVDYWAITQSQPYKIYKYYEYIRPYHVQPYFVMVYEKLLHSVAWKEFWDTLVIPETYTEAVKNYELRFAEYFAERGFTGGAYIDETEFYETADVLQPYIVYEPYRLVSECKCPFIKRKAFSLSINYLMNVNINESKKALQYIREHTPYDERLIWEDLISHLTPQALIDSMGLYTIIGDKCEKRVSASEDVCILYDITDSDYLRIFKKYANQLLEAYDVYRTSKDNILEDYSEYRASYKYICIIHDNLYRQEDDSRNINEKEWDCMNTIGSKEFIDNVVQEFETNKCLGMLVPLKCHGTFGEDVEINSRKNYFSDCSALWIKTDAVKQLNPLDNMFGYNMAELVKQGKYYSALIVYQGAATELLQRSYYMLHSLVCKLTYGYGYKGLFSTLRIVNFNIFEFCKKYSTIYIYGAGDYGHRCLALIKDKLNYFAGFIVSDGYKKNNAIKEKIHEISEIFPKENEGIIVACNECNKETIMHELKKRQFTNIIDFSDSK